MRAASASFSDDYPHAIYRVQIVSSFKTKGQVARLKIEDTFRRDAATYDLQGGAQKVAERIRQIADLVSELSATNPKAEAHPPYLARFQRHPDF